MFSKKLLKQKNYHINLIDSNGFISEETYFPHNIDKMPKFIDFYNYYLEKKKWYPGNEIIFHDSIDLSNLCEIWVSSVQPKEHFNKLKKLLPDKYKNMLKIKERYEPIRCMNDGIIDTEKLPFFLCFRSQPLKDFYFPFKNKKFIAR